MKIFAQELAKSAQEPAGECSGVLIKAAALKGAAVEFITDKSECAREAAVTTVVYEPPRPGRGVGSRTQDYNGTVRVHPELELLHDARNLVWSNADLAVILLDTPVAEEEKFPAYKLPLESGSVEFIAGAQRLEAGVVASHVYGGDSGGGCFSAGDNTVLVGVVGSRAENAKGESFSVFTSVYAHRKWLDEQIQEAASLSAAPRSR